MLSVQEGWADGSLYWQTINNLPLRQMPHSRRKNDSILYLLFPYPVDGDNTYLLRSAIARAKNIKIIAYNRNSVPAGILSLWGWRGGVIKQAPLCLGRRIFEKGAGSILRHLRAPSRWMSGKRVTPGLEHKVENSTSRSSLSFTTTFVSCKINSCKRI